MAWFTPAVGYMSSSEDCYLEFIQTGWTLALQKRLFLKRHALQSAGLKIEWNGVPMEWKTGWAEDLKNFVGNVDSDSEECLFCLI